MYAIIGTICGIALQIIVKTIWFKREHKNYIYDAENKCWIPKRNLK